MTPIKICVSLAERRIQDLIPLMEEAAERGASLIEVRLDYLESLNGVERLVREAPLPLIATNRRFDQGGFRRQDETSRIHNLLEAAEAGFQYADVELTTDNIGEVMSRLKSLNVKPIVSFHDFNGTPKLEDMERIVESQLRVGAEICKLITTARKFEDNLSCLNLLSKAGRNLKIVCFAMGGKGLISRVLAPIFGSHFTYASLIEGKGTAPGQISIDNLKRIYDLLGVNRCM